MIANKLVIRISRDTGNHKFVIIFGHISVVSLFKSYLWKVQGPGGIVCCTPDY